MVVACCLLVVCTASLIAELRPSLKAGPPWSTGLKSVPARLKTRSGRVSVFIAFSRLRHDLLILFCYIVRIRFRVGFSINVREMRPGPAEAGGDWPGRAAF